MIAINKIILEEQDFNAWQCNSVYYSNKLRNALCESILARIHDNGFHDAHPRIILVLALRALPSCVPIFMNLSASPSLSLAPLIAPLSLMVNTIADSRGVMIMRP
jgi:hypothetical protein